MSDILEELLQEILLINEKASVPSTRNPGEVWKTRGGFGAMNRSRNIEYFSDRKSADAYAKGKVSVSVEKPAKETEPKATVSTTDKERPKIATAPLETDKLKKKLASTKKDSSKKALTALLGAIDKKDPTSLQRTIDTIGLVISAEGKLKATAYKGGSDVQKIAGDDKEFARYMYDLAKEIGVEIPGGTPKEDSEVESASSLSEQFKPSSLFKNEPVKQLDIKSTETGIVVEEMELSLATEEQITSTETTLLERARQIKQERGEDVTPEFEENIKRYVRGVYAKANHNVQYLRDLASGGNDLSVYEFRGNDGVSTIVGNLTNVIKQTVTNVEEQSAIITALNSMASAKDAVEFSKTYKTFSDALKGTPIENTKKYIVESLTAIRTIVMGGVSIIPKSDSFKLADVVGIRKNPLTGDINASQFIVDINEEQSISAAGSVKQGDGNAGVTEPKLQNSQFDTGEVDGVDCSSVKEDLIQLSRMGVDIFKPTDDGNVTPETKTKLLGVIKKYSPIIKAYYGIDADTSDESLYDFLSYGKEMKCYDGKPVPSLPDKATGKMEPYSQGKSANGGQWRAWSVLGKMTDAIHNRTVTYQFYDTVRYNGEVTVADGIRKMSKMKSQHLKKKINMKGKEGFTRPDSALNAHTIPATLEQTRNGNPCQD